MRFCSLGSGSRGNGTLVVADDVCVLIDCGFSVRELRRRMNEAGLDLPDLSAILVTHEHSDHAQGVLRAARASGARVFATAGTWRGMKVAAGVVEEVIAGGKPFQLGNLEVVPVTVPHDAREPVQFRFVRKGRQLGVLTDLGHPTAHVAESFSGCDGLLLEFNHDPEMLRNGRYPEPLKRRVGGDFGHLANAQAAQLLAALVPERLQVVVAGHLSEQNNTRELAATALAGVMDGLDGRTVLARQDSVTEWLAVE